MSDHEQTEQGASAADDSLMRRFQVGGGTELPRLIISNANGAVRVRGGAAGETFVTLRAVKGNGEALPIELVAEVSVRRDGEIVVKARPFGEVQRQVRRVTKSLDFQRSDFLDNLGEVIDALSQMKTAGRNLGQVLLEATVPPQCDLLVNTATGAIQVQGVAGEIELKSASGRIEGRQLGGKLAARTASGDVHVNGVEGTAYLQSMSGEIDAARIAGDVVIHTTSGETRARAIVGQLGFKSLSGDLNVEQSRLNGFYINNTSGECAIDAVLEPGNYEVRTVSGEVRLRTQPDLAGLLSGRTVSGEFRCELPYRYAGDDWKSRLDADDEGRGPDADEESDDDDTEISLPGIRIGKGRVELPGITIDERGVGVFGMRFDEQGIDMPGLGVRIGQNRSDRDRWDGRDRDRGERRERRRSRNRWEFLIGDPAMATTGKTRLRIRTVSGSVTLRAGRGEPVVDRQPSVLGVAVPTPPARPATADRRGWPDSELWPSRIVAETGAVETAHEAAPPIPPMAPVAPDVPTPPAAPPEARSAASVADVAAADATTLPEPLSVEAGTEDAAEASATDDAPEATLAAVPNRERTRLDILEALERGEINADEALRLLRRLDS